MAAPKIGILGQNKPAANTDTVCYTVPAGRRAVISTLVIAESGGATAAVSINARINGAAVSVANTLAYQLPISANSHTGITEGWTLGPGDVLNVFASTANVTFTLFGEETDVPTA